MNAVGIETVNLRIIDANSPVNESMHVPGLSRKLLSVTQIISNGNKVTFNKDNSLNSKKRSELLVESKALGDMSTTDAKTFYSIGGTAE